MPMPESVTLGSGAVTNNAALVFNRSDALTQAAAIDGTGSLAQIGGGTLTLPSVRNPERHSLRLWSHPACCRRGQRRRNRQDRRTAIDPRRRRCLSRLECWRICPSDLDPDCLLGEWSASGVHVSKLYLHRRRLRDRWPELRPILLPLSRGATLRVFTGCGEDMRGLNSRRPRRRIRILREALFPD